MSLSEFINCISRTAKISFWPPQGERCCIITRTPGIKDNLSSCVIEWKDCVLFCYGDIPIWFNDKTINRKYRHKAEWIVSRFLSAHPANADGSPVWIDEGK